VRSSPPDQPRGTRRRGGDGTGLEQDVAATLQPGFAGTSVPGWLDQARAGGLVSVCLYGDNVTEGAGLGPVCAALHERLPGVLLAVDEEGGDVTRVHYPHGSTVVGNAVLGRIDDEALTRRTAAAIGGELAALGIGLDLAPVLDVNSNPANPVIGVRSLGADPADVSRHGVAWVEGLQGAGVAACAKHFPGHGDTVADSHHGLPRVDAPLEVLHERELAPFAAAARAGVASVMTSHVVVAALDPDRPATFSPTVLGIIRDGLGFDGVIVSDALDMAGASAETGIPEAAVQALAAGVDLLCLGSMTPPGRYTEVHAAVVEAVRSGRLDRARVTEAAERVRRLAESYRPVPSDGPAAADLPDGLVAGAFTVTDAAREFVADPATLVVVQVETTANLAVGPVSWGPAALDATVAEGEVPDGAKVAVVGRGLGDGHPAHEAVSRLRAAGHRVVLVECGWPRGGADVETFGGSPAVATPLLALLQGRLDR
jgi:beta-N-acetylhexosaminidase